MAVKCTFRIKNHLTRKLGNHLTRGSTRTLAPIAQWIESLTSNQ